LPNEISQKEQDIGKILKMIVSSGQLLENNISLSLSIKIWETV